MKKILFSIFFLLAIMPAMASDGTKFTVFGQVSDIDGTPINGVTVTLSVSGSSISTTTANVTQVNGNNASGYYVLELANLPSGANDEPTYVNAGDSMTITATTTGKSASWTGPRAASEPQEVNLQLSTGGGGSSGGGGGVGSSGGGGGGGGGASGENYTNIQAKESREEFIAKDLPAAYNFTTPGLPVYGIVITGNNNAGLITAQIELLKDTSTLVKEKPPGTVYKNVNIWVGTAGFATPKNIKEAIIKFKVESSWITSGGFKDAEIFLLRWDGTQWVRLETQLKYKDDGFTHFEAKTTAFSPFAIVGLKGVTVPTSPIETGTAPKPGGTASPKPVTSTGSIVLVIILAVALILAIYKFKLLRR
ncbi:Uncharacterised protein [uncultured archaeon]|nr:Uncharacterised protein [uncultured archaeon]